MDGHVEDASMARDRPSETEERLRKKAKQPRERNYGVIGIIVVVSDVNHHLYCYRRQRVLKQLQIIRDHKSHHLSDVKEAIRSSSMKMRRKRF